MHISLLFFDFKLINLSEKNPCFANRYYPIINIFFLIFVLSFSHSLLSRVQKVKHNTALAFNKDCKW